MEIRGALNCLPADLRDALESAATPEWLAASWNEAVTNSRLPRCLSMNGARRRDALHRLTEHPAREFWSTVIETALRSDWFAGKITNRDGTAKFLGSFDYLLKPGVAIRLMEELPHTWDVHVDAIVASDVRLAE